MPMMPKFDRSRLKPTGDILIDMIQAQEIKLMRARRDDRWDSHWRRMGSRMKHLETELLEYADREKLKLYYIHLTKKELEKME